MINPTIASKPGTRRHNNVPARSLRAPGGVVRNGNVSDPRAPKQTGDPRLDLVLRVVALL